MAQIKPDIETCAKIKVIGVGGGGGNALNRMVTEGIRGIEFIAVNTDAQALHVNAAPLKIPIGKSVTRGLGAGMNPQMGKNAVEESAQDIRNALGGADMVFLTAGLGGGTGSGAASEIAKIAREVGALTVAVVTKPFIFEGPQRKRIADDAHQELSQHVDTIITIPNDRVLQIIDKNTTIQDAFRIIDDVLRQGVQGIAEMITTAGEINVDFADVKAIMQNSGSALMGIGKAKGENRAVEAAKQAIASPLLEVSIDGAKGILFTVTGGPNVTMFEVTEASKVITSAADDDAKIIFGLIRDESLEDEIRVTVVATGFDNREMRRAPSLGGEVTIAAKSGWQQSPLKASPFANAPMQQQAPSASPFGSPQPVQSPVSASAASASSESPFGRRSFAQPPVSSMHEEDEVVPAQVDRRTVSFAVPPPQQTERRMPQQQVSAAHAQDAQKDEEGEWAIPAFLRKKMM
ncbi:cell division protein FtsZ [bacterium]|nr:cell division protein FtsZ [bacterium]